MYFIMMHNSFSPDYINHCCSKYQKISRKYVQRYIYIFIDSLNEDFNVVVQKKDLGGEGGGARGGGRSDLRILNTFGVLRQE